eukprot:TRINITY_DN3123_c0_g3_i1.p3 TRINITY_DN3123_c0_g3~~TRINITY_DN3123_c0_g3_i1.p3  ORF type:complete len:282 (-),score=33.89 TRINITY_DN3123_c0_g3_i1:224-1009(-)
MRQSIVTIILITCLQGEGIIAQSPSSPTISTSNIPPKVSIVDIVSPSNIEPVSDAASPNIASEPESEVSAPQTTAAPIQETGSSPTQQNPTTLADIQPKVSTDGPSPETPSNGGFGQALLQLPGGPIPTLSSPPQQDSTELEPQEVQGLVGSMEPGSEDAVELVEVEFGPPPPLIAEYIVEDGSGVAELVVVTEEQIGPEQEIDVEEIPVYTYGQIYSQTDNSEQNEVDDGDNMGNTLYNNPNVILCAIFITSISVFLLQC